MRLVKVMRRGNTRKILSEVFGFSSSWDRDKTLIEARIDFAAEGFSFRYRVIMTDLADVQALRNQCERILAKAEKGADHV